jgi:hypothetical protein
LEDDEDEVGGWRWRGRGKDPQCSASQKIKKIPTKQAKVLESSYILYNNNKYICPPSAPGFSLFLVRVH